MKNNLQSKVKRIYLHLGYPKTGTTFIQQKIFQNISKLKVYSKPKRDIIKTTHPHDGILRRFFFADPTIWRDKGEELFKDLIGEAETDVIISEENITNLTNTPALIRDHVLKFSRLANEFGFKTKVLLTIRNQATKIASGYAQRSNRLSSPSQSHFEKQTKKLLDKSQNYYYGKMKGIMLNYDNLIGKISSILGNENVSVLPYELLKNDIEVFLEKLLRAVGRERSEFMLSKNEIKNENKRNARSIASMRWSLRRKTLFSFWLRPGRLFRAVGLPMKVSIPRPRPKSDSSIELTNELAKSILKRYNKSNKNLSKKLPFDLKKYGYYS